MCHKVAKARFPRQVSEDVAPATPLVDGVRRVAGPVPCPIMDQVESMAQSTVFDDLGQLSHVEVEALNFIHVEHAERPVVPGLVLG